MKQGWEIKKLGEVCLSLEDGDWIEKKNQSSAGIRLIQTGNIGCGFYKDKIDKAKYISEDTFNTLRCTEVIAGDILISRLPEPVGRACIVPKLRTKCITAVDCSIVKLNPNLILASWFIYYTQSADYTAKVVSECSGTTRDRISRKKLSVITVPIPPLDEQERIVEILDREFERIDALKANAEQNLQHAKDLFQSALKQELQPKEGWYISTLQEMLKLTSGDNLTAKSIINGDYPVYGGNGIMGYHNQYNLDGKNVIVGRVGALCGNVRLVEGKIWYTDNAFLVHDKKKIFYLPFLTYELQNANLRQYATQAAQPVVSNASMKDVVLAVPPSIKEQEGIVARLEELNERCKALEENYRKTIALCDDMKQALLRQAFNGEL